MEQTVRFGRFISGFLDNMATPMKNATSTKDFDSYENLTDCDEIKNAYTDLCKEEVMKYLLNAVFSFFLLIPTKRQ